MADRTIARTRVEGVTVAAGTVEEGMVEEGATRMYASANRLLAITLMLIGSAHAQDASTCLDCPAWNVTQEPFRIYGNTHYVGVRGLGSILITSAEGHVLIDGALPESAAKIAAGIRGLGFRLEEVELIVNSHAHFDHAGGIAELQRLSGARVAASASSAPVLRNGRSGRDDPQYGILMAFPPVANVEVIRDGDILRVGPIVLTAHVTSGHAPGGTSWTWRSCEGSRCVDMVYADSLSAVSAPDFKFTRGGANAHRLEDFEKAFAIVEGLPCDILLTPHPEATGLWERLQKRTGGGPDALIDRSACRRYAAGARQRLAARLAEERK